MTVFLSSPKIPSGLRFNHSIPSPEMRSEFGRSEHECRLKAIPRLGTDSLGDHGSPSVPAVACGQTPNRATLVPDACKFHKLVASRKYVSCKGWLGLGLDHARIAQVVLDQSKLLKLLNPRCVVRPERFELPAPCFAYEFKLATLWARLALSSL